MTIYLRPPKKTGQPSEITGRLNLYRFDQLEHQQKIIYNKSDSLKGRRRRPLSKYADQFQLSCTSSTVNNTSIPDITWSLTYDNGSYTELNISQLPKGFLLATLLSNRLNKHRHSLNRRTEVAFTTLSCIGNSKLHFHSDAYVETSVRGYRRRLLSHSF